MDLFIIYAQGVRPRVVIWPLEVPGLLKRTAVSAAGTMQNSTSMVGDVPEIYRHEAELVLMPLNHLWAGR